jgi:hypothetical protein
MRKHQAIDLVLLYSTCTWKDWNRFLTECYEKRDIQKLAQTRYELQAGMADLAKKKMNSEKMCEWFVRLQRSIEKTIKNIIRDKYPNPCDNPLIAKDHMEQHDAKKARDQQLELFLKKSGY